MCSNELKANPDEEKYDSFYCLEEETLLLSPLIIGLLIGISSCFFCLLLCRCRSSGTSNKYYPLIQNKIVIITGANTGIGLLSAQELAKLQAKVVILACRSETRAIAAISYIKSKCNVDNLEYMHMDLADLSSVKSFAENFKEKYG